MSDRRDVIKNRKAIWQAYLDAAEEKAGGKVTVKDIITRADVSRGTFYAYYKSADDLRSQITHEFLQMMLELNRSSLEHLPDSPYESILNILKSFSKNRRMINALTGSGTDPSLFEEWQKNISGILCDVFSFPDQQEADTTVFCISSLINDNCRITACGDQKIPVEKRASVLARFIPKKNR